MEEIDTAVNSDCQDDTEGGVSGLGDADEIGERFDLVLCSIV